MKRPAITVIGSYAVGLTMRVNRFPTAGETLMGHSFTQMHGGKGSNQEVECSRLGAEVKLIASIGNDILGRNALELYKEEGVNCDGVKLSEKLSTGVGFIIVDDHGHNVITLDLGANMELTPVFIESVAENAIVASDVILMQLEVPTETVLTAAAIAKRHGVKVILNPAPYQKLPDKIWPMVDIMAPNEKEAKLMLGYNPEEDINIERLGKELMAKGAGSVVISGCYFVGNEIWCDFVNAA